MKATFHAQFAASDRVRGKARLLRASVGPPTNPEGVVVKVTLEIPDAAFEPLTADGVIEAGFVGIPIPSQAGELECANCGQTMLAGVEHVCFAEEE